MLLCDLGEQRQRGEANQEGVRRRTFPQSEDCRERVALPLRQPIEVTEHGSAQLMQAAVGQFHLGLDSCGSRELEALDALGEVVEERTLAHAGIASEHEGPAADRSARGSRAGRALYTRPDAR